MIIFKKRNEKRWKLLEKLRKECEERNANAKWENKYIQAHNKYKIYKIVLKVGKKFKYEAKEIPLFYIDNDYTLSKCTITDLSCGYQGDCRTCIEPMMVPKHRLTELETQHLK
jgi:hypothetical protein